MSRAKSEHRAGSASAFVHPIGMRGKGSTGRILSLLVDAKKNNRTVAIYLESNDFQSLEVGFVEYVDDSILILQCLTAKGEADGRRTHRISGVSRVDVDSTYTRKLALLYQYRDTLYAQDFGDGPGLSASMREILDYAKDHSELVQVVDDSDFGPTGYVLAVDDDFVEMKRIDHEGSPDGLAVVDMDSITKIHFGRRQEQMLSFLHRYHHGLRRLIG